MIAPSEILCSVCKSAKKKEHGLHPSRSAEVEAVVDAIENWIDHRAREKKDSH